jgi:hypothetical protein
MGLFADDGTPNPGMASDLIAAGPDLYDGDVQNLLAPPGSGRSMDEFEKRKTQYYTLPDGQREYNIHYYYDKVTGKAIFDHGFKIRFRQLYTP